MGANASHETRKKVDVLWKDVDELSEEAKEYIQVLETQRSQQLNNSVGIAEPEGQPDDHSDIVDSVIDDNEIYPENGEVNDEEEVTTEKGEEEVTAEKEEEEVVEEEVTAEKEEVTAEKEEEEEVAAEEVEEEVVEEEVTTEKEEVEESKEEEEVVEEENPTDIQEDPTDIQEEDIE